MKRELPCNGKPLIMGILNVTPDSFYDGGRYAVSADAICHARKLIDEGADIIDVGGESTRPFSEPTLVDEELRRVIPVISAIRQESEVLISIDTYKSRVAEEALNAGADIVNDVSGFLLDPRMVMVAKNYHAYSVIMHMKGTPGDMQENPQYDDVVAEITEFFRERIRFAEGKGVARENIILDPGIGFGKRVADNLRIMKNLHRFKEFGMPVLVGTSMKSFIGTTTGSALEDRKDGTLASVAVALWNGADIVRVHHVKEARRVAAFVNAVKAA